jgi:hypothetical protein
MASELEKIIQEWGDDQIAEAVLIIERSNASNTGNLAKSLRFEVKEIASGLLLRVYDAKYSDFVRKGVRGSLSSAKAPKSPFAYDDKMPPAGPITKWAIKKGINGTRNAKGQFIKRKSLIFLIRRSIFRFGFRPLNFYAPFFKNINELQGQISEEQKREILLLLSKAFK